MHRISRVALALNQFPDCARTIVLYECYFCCCCDLRGEKNEGRMVAGRGEHFVA